MTMELKAGDRVRCVDAKGYASHRLTKGAEHVIRYRDGHFVALDGDGAEYAQWDVSRFKPIVRVKAPTRVLMYLPYTHTSPATPHIFAGVQSC